MPRRPERRLGRRVEAARHHLREPDLAGGLAQHLRRRRHADGDIGVVDRRRQVCERPDSGEAFDFRRRRVNRQDRTRKAERLQLTDVEIAVRRLRRRRARHRDGVRLKERCEIGRPRPVRRRRLRFETRARVDRDGAMLADDQRIDVELRDGVGMAQQQPVCAAKREHGLDQRLAIDRRPTAIAVQ